MRPTRPTTRRSTTRYWVSLASLAYVAFVASPAQAAEELKKPDFVLPEVIIRGQLEQSINLHRDALLLPSPLAAMTVKETPLASAEDPLGDRIGKLPLVKPAPLTDPGLRDALLHQDSLDEWFLGGGIFGQVWGHGISARQWDQARYLAQLDHRREDGRVPRDGRVDTSGMVDVQLALSNSVKIGASANMRRALQELPSPLSAPLTALDRFSADTSVFGAYQWAPKWRMEVSGGWQVVQDAQGGWEDLLMRAKWSGEGVLEGLAEHQWWWSGAVRHDGSFGAVGFFSLEDHWHQEAWSCHAGLRVDGPSVNPMARVFFTAAPQTVLFAKFEPRQEYAEAAHVSFEPYAERPTSLAPTHIPVAIGLGLESTVAAGWLVKAEVGYEKTESFMAWEDRNGNRLFETVWLPTLERWLPRLTITFNPSSEWEIEGVYRGSWISGLPSGFLAVPHLPAHEGGLTARYREGGHLVGVELSGLGERKGDRAGSLTVGGNVKAGARAETSLSKGWSLWLKLDNLFNSAIQEREGYEGLPFRGMIGLKGQW